MCLILLGDFNHALAAPEVTSIGEHQYRVLFRFAAPETATSVHLAGSFNGWSRSAEPMAREGDSATFVATRTLPPGRHEYKFLVDGQHWHTDPDNPRRGAFDNAVLYIEVAPEATEPVVPQPPAWQPADRPHPAQVRAWSDGLAAAPPDERDGLAAALFREWPMPHLTDTTATFIWAGQGPAPPTVILLAGGAEIPLELTPFGPAPGLFARTVDIRTIPQPWAYWLELREGDAARRVLDPHGWSVTSREGRPATRGIADSSRAGRIELLPSLPAASANVQPRDIYVYLPPGYDQSPARYPVLYMHDGQNAWDDPIHPFGHGGWQVNVVADRLIGEGRVRPFIVVALACTADRLTEYGPGEDILDGAAHPYIAYLERQVKAHIDAHYRTLAGPAHTFLIGSSMGGAIALQAALLRPEVFGGAACLSPALMFKDKAGRGYLDLVEKTGKRDVRLYIDHGTAGPTQDGSTATRALVAALRQAGWRDGAEILRFEDAGAAHNESAWRARLHRPLLFLFSD